MNLNNCALGDKCECINYSKYCMCPNWGRSTLSAPAIIGRDPSYGSGGKRVARPTNKPKRGKQ